MTERATTITPALCSPETMRRLVRILWIDVGKETNPWTTAMASGMDEYRQRWQSWFTTHVELLRAMNDVVSGRSDPSEELIVRALNFLDGKP